MKLSNFKSNYVLKNDDEDGEVKYLSAKVASMRVKEIPNNSLLKGWIPAKKDNLGESDEDDTSLPSSARSSSVSEEEKPQPVAVGKTKAATRVSSSSEEDTFVSDEKLQQLQSNDAPKSPRSDVVEDPAWVKEDFAHISTAVERIFQGYEFSRQETAEIEDILRKETGKRDFGSILNQQRVKDMCVPNSNFNLFVSLLETALDGADEVPSVGRMLMHMSATYYRSVGEMHEFAQSRLQHLSIWKNMNFWSRSLCDAITVERNKIVSIEKFKFMSDAEQEDYVEREQNIAFSHIGAFTHNMLSLSLDVDEVHKFVTKWCAFFSLTNEMEQQLSTQVDMLAVTLAQDELERKKKLQKELWLMQKKQEWMQSQQDAQRRKKEEKNIAPSPPTFSLQAVLSGSKSEPTSPHHSQNPLTVSQSPPPSPQPRGGSLTPDNKDEERKAQWKEEVKKQWEEEQDKRRKKIAKDKEIQSGLQFKPMSKEELLKLQKEEWLKQKKNEWQRSLRERHNNTLARVSIDENGYIKSARPPPKSPEAKPTPTTTPKLTEDEEEQHSQSAIYPSQARPKRVSRQDRSASMEKISADQAPKQKPSWRSYRPSLAKKATNMTATFRPEEHGMVFLHSSPFRKSSMGSLGFKRFIKSKNDSS